MSSKEIDVSNKYHFNSSETDERTLFDYNLYKQFDSFIVVEPKYIIPDTVTIQRINNKTNTTNGSPLYIRNDTFKNFFTKLGGGGNTETPKRKQDETVEPVVVKILFIFLQITRK